jgi:hypothetical protein
MILNSPTISGSLTVTGNIIASGSITLSGSVASSSFASTASFVALAQSASNAVSAATASFANAFTVASTLTAQTLVVQTITSSVDFVTGSTRFGSIIDNTHVFTGSLLTTGSVRFGSSNQQTSGNERIYVGQNSAVGIDDANSLSLFVTHAPATGSPQIGFTYQFRQNDNSGANLYGDAIKVIKNAGANSTYTVFTTNSTIGAGTERMRIDANGNVSIGATSFTSPSGADTVLGVYGGQDCSIILQDAVQLWELYVNDDFYINRGSTTVLTALRSNGNVGINTTSPTSNLHINVNSGLLTQDILKVQGGGSPSGNYGFACLSNNGDKIFYTDHLTYNVIANSAGGKFGIGTTTPGQLLEVNGNIISSVTGKIGFRYSSTDANLYSYLRSGTASNVGPIILAGGFESGGGGNEAIRLCTNNGAGGERTALSINNAGSVTIAGSLSKGSGTFKIDHPLESKKDTHQLVHSFIEGPRADLIYRGTVTLTNGSTTINIDTFTGMTEGTFTALNRDIQCFTTNESGWDLVKGKVEGNILTITSQNTESTDEISWMVVGERQDKHIKETDWTDENGKPILEPLKSTE